MLKRVGFKRRGAPRPRPPKLQPVTLPINVRPMAAPSQGTARAKDNAVASRRLRDSARGEQCTVQIPGVCDCSTEKTVLAHLPSEVRGSKATDLSSAYACHACHSVIDRRTINEAFERDREWFLRRATVRTQHRWLCTGLMTLAGYNA